MKNRTKNRRENERVRERERVIYRRKISQEKNIQATSDDTFNNTFPPIALKQNN